MKPLTQSIKVQRVRRPAAFVQERVLKSALLLFQEVEGFCTKNIYKIT